MTKKKAPSYVPAPQGEVLARQRYLVVQQVSSGECSVSEGARLLGMSRHRFQTLLHRSQAAMLEELRQKSPGRPPQPEGQAQLKRDRQRLLDQNESLRKRLANMTRALEMAADLLQARFQTPRARAASRPRRTREPDDPEAEAHERLREATAMRRLGLKARLAAALVGVCAATLHRWGRRLGDGERLRLRRGPTARVPEESAVRSASALVRQLHGLIGAAAIARLVPALSRRQAAGIKQAELTAMENDRKAHTIHVLFTQPGIVRGFDAMYVETTEGRRYPLVSADGAVPYRTQIEIAARYDTASVYAAIERDLQRHGAPLVYRLDRAKAHLHPAVEELLARHGVLALHGPPHYPCFYGQLERQNREHRAWLCSLGPQTPEQLAHECRTMARALSDRWPRRSLGWATAADCWRVRPTITERERDDFRTEVYHRTLNLSRHLEPKRSEDGVVERLAIEQALQRRGYLRLVRGEGAV